MMEPEGAVASLTTEDDFMKTANLIYVIHKDEREIDEIKMQAKEAQSFYKERIKSIENNIEYLKGRIAAYLQLSNQTKIVSHLGTAYIAKRDKDTWPSDDILAEFAAQHNIQEAFVIRLDPSAVKEWCKKNSTYPTGYQRDESSTIVIREASRRTSSEG